MAAAKASISPWSASDSFIFRTRITARASPRRSGWPARFGAQPGKYCAALISRVIAKSWWKSMRPALSPTILRGIGDADERILITLSGQPLDVPNVGRVALLETPHQVLGLRASEPSD